MADSLSNRPDPRLRPADPAGTQPRVDPESLVPKDPTPLLGPGGEAEIDAEAVELDDGEAQTLALPEPAIDEAPVAEAAASTALVPTDPGGGLGAPAHLESEHAPRFQFLFGALGALGFCAIVLVGLALFAPRPKAAPAWSAWAPPSASQDPLSDIAGHVADEYHLADGSPMFGITASVGQINYLPVTLFVSRNGDVATLKGTPVIYTMCGFGPNCTIVGKPSTQRQLLVRRAALELALYTFRYVDGADQVAVFMPAAVYADKGSRTATLHNGLVLLIERGDVRAELARPLVASVAPRPPSIRAVEQAADTPLVTQLTSRLYAWRSGSSGAQAFVVLQAIPQT